MTLRVSRKQASQQRQHGLARDLPSWTNPNITTPTRQAWVASQCPERDRHHRFPAGVYRSIVSPRLDCPHCTQPARLAPSPSPEPPTCGTYVYVLFVLGRREHGPHQDGSRGLLRKCIALAPINRHFDPCLPSPSQLRPPPLLQGRYVRSGRTISSSEACGRSRGPDSYVGQVIDSWAETVWYSGLQQNSPTRKSLGGQIRS